MRSFIQAHNPTNFEVHSLSTLENHIFKFITHPLNCVCLSSGVARGGQDGARAPGATWGRWNDLLKKWHKEREKGKVNQLDVGNEKDQQK